MPDTHEPRRPHTPSMADPFMEIDLAAELARLRGESAWSGGHNARTLIKHADLRVVLIAIAAHARIAEHKAGGRISIQVLEGHIRLKALGRHQEVRVTRTGCMGRCGEGPTVAVYPDGVWYRGVRAEDADELVREHLIQDRLVARLVDQIMQ